MISKSKTVFLSLCLAYFYIFAACGSDEKSEGTLKDGGNGDDAGQNGTAIDGTPGENDIMDGFAGNTDSGNPDAAGEDSGSSPGELELLVFDLDRPVTTADRGFPKVEPIAKPEQNIEAMLPGSNEDWTSPINYADGTLHMRVYIRSQPEPQSMRLQFCIWQYNFTLETCTSQASVSGEPGTEVTWSQAVSDMWKKDGNPMDWENPRQRYGVAIKNTAGLPVSDYSGWEWNGEDPSKWYPLDMHFTVVAVPEGETFSGWENY